MRLTMDLSWQKLLIITLVFGTGAVIGSQAFPKTVTETQTLPATFECNDLNQSTMAELLWNQTVFETSNCYGTVVQDENGTTRIIGDCLIPQ